MPPERGTPVERRRPKTASWSATDRAANRGRSSSMRRSTARVPPATSGGPVSHRSRSCSAGVCGPTMPSMKPSRLRGAVRSLATGTSVPRRPDCRQRSRTRSPAWSRSAAAATGTTSASPAQICSSRSPPRARGAIRSRENRGRSVAPGRSAPAVRTSRGPTPTVTVRSPGDRPSNRGSDPAVKVRTASPSSASSGPGATSAPRSATTASRLRWPDRGSVMPAWCRPVAGTGAAVAAADGAGRSGGAESDEHPVRRPAATVAPVTSRNARRDGWRSSRCMMCRVPQPPRDRRSTSLSRRGIRRRARLESCLDQLFAWWRRYWAH